MYRDRYIDPKDEGRGEFVYPMTYTLGMGAIDPLSDDGILEMRAKMRADALLLLRMKERRSQLPLALGSLATSAFVMGWEVAPASWASVAKVRACATERREGRAVLEAAPLTGR